VKNCALCQCRWSPTVTTLKNLYVSLSSIGTYAGGRFEGGTFGVYAEGGAPASLLMGILTAYKLMAQSMMPV